jgi:type IX secretion system PorP/SprF family membrane protein
MNMKKKIAFIAGLLSCSLVFSQDIHFSMFNYSPLTLNPANAGADDEIRVNLNYRSQWKSVTSQFKTMAGSYDMRISKVGNGYLAGGLNFFNDKAGDSQMGITQANLSLAYHLKLADEHTIGLGLMGGYAQRSMTSSALTWGNQYDGMSYNSTLLTGESAVGDFAKSFFDLGTGVVYTFQKGEKYSTGNDHLAANVGFSVMHVHSPDMSFYGSTPDLLYRKYLFHANGLIGIPNSRISFAPGIMFARQGSAQELMIGTNIRYRLVEDSRYTGIIKGASLSLGTWFRTGDAMVFTSLLQMAGYSIGFAYDYNISPLREASNGKGGIEMCFKFVYPNSSSYGKKSSTRFL